MTFCLGIKVKDGIVGIADTRITSGRECTRARKVAIIQKEGSSLFIMTSGLRSLRDKALTYFNEILDETDEEFDKLYKVINAFSMQIKRVADEDKTSLLESGLQFDIHCLVGGQFKGDKEPKLYLLYPQGNWVEVNEGTPYHIIGATGYGKPVLDRTLKFNDSVNHALKVGMLAFDSTFISSNDVDYPLDIVFCGKDTFTINEVRIEKSEIQGMACWWQERLRKSVNEIPLHELDTIITRLTDFQE